MTLCRRKFHAGQRSKRTNGERGALLLALRLYGRLRHTSCTLRGLPSRAVSKDKLSGQALRPVALPIGQFPTPLHEMPWLSARLGRRVLVKRDDLSGLALGGNKARKLAYLVADALDSGCDTLVANGFLQSNNAVQVAAAAVRFGLKAVLCLDGATPNVARGNVLLGALYGAELVFFQWPADAGKLPSPRLWWRCTYRAARPMCCRPAARQRSAFAASSRPWPRHASSSTHWEPR